MAKCTGSLRPVHVGLRSDSTMFDFSSCYGSCVGCVFFFTNFDQTSIHCRSSLPLYLGVISCRTCLLSTLISTYFAHCGRNTEHLWVSKTQQLFCPQCPFHSAVPCVGSCVSDEREDICRLRHVRPVKVDAPFAPVGALFWQGKRGKNAKQRSQRPLTSLLSLNVVFRSSEHAWFVCTRMCENFCLTRGMEVWNVAGERLGCLLFTKHCLHWRKRAIFMFLSTSRRNAFKWVFALNKFEWKIVSGHVWVAKEFTGGPQRVLSLSLESAVGFSLQKKKTDRLLCILPEPVGFLW